MTGIRREFTLARWHAEAMMERVDVLAEELRIISRQLADARDNAREAKAREEAILARALKAGETLESMF